VFTNDKADYISPPRKVQVSIEGLGGKSVARLVGTVEWSFEDDDGRVVTWRIQNTCFFEDAPYRLLSPQHWVQVTEEKVGDDWCKTDSREVSLISKKNSFRRTIQLDHASNVAILRTVPQFTTYRSFASEVSGIRLPIDEREMMTM